MSPSEAAQQGMLEQCFAPEETQDAVCLVEEILMPAKALVVAAVQ